MNTKYVVAAGAALIVLGVAVWQVQKSTKAGHQAPQNEAPAPPAAQELKTAISHTGLKLDLEVYTSQRKFELPAPISGEQIVQHTGYTLSYNEKHEQPSWVAWDITKGEVAGNMKRNIKFMADPSVSTGSATNDDYKGTGYDRGHLCPAGDMKWSPAAMSDCFLMSNMSPQLHVFNAGIWEQLENRCRDWAKSYGKIYVVAGPVLGKGETERIGRANKITVPKYFYKVVLLPETNNVRGIGYLFEHKEHKGPLDNFAVSIDSVEKFTGLDFFPALPDKVEEEIERQAISLD